jgi:integrase
MALKFAKLTRTNIRSLSHKQEISEHGITFKRLSNGDGRFAVNIMVDGQRVHRVIGKESEGVTRLQAEDFIEKARTDARHGRLNLPKGRKFGFSFDEAAKKYLEKLINEGGKDIPKKTYRLKNHVTPYFKNIPFAKITTSQIERYKKMRLDNNAKPSTINRELAVISHLFNKAVEWGWLEHKPCKTSKLKEDNKKIVYLTIEQSKNLLETAKKDRCPYIYLFILIALETSMRRMEILTIEQNNINLEHNTIFLPKAKAGARTQPITKNLAKYLNEYMAGLNQNETWLFPSTFSKTGYVTSIEGPFKRVVIDAGLNPKEVVRHTLRHTAITHLVQAGVDLPTVQRISGHKTFQMVVRYSHQNAEHIQSAMDTLEKRYSSNK